MWIERQIKDRVNRCVQSRPAILVTGARQTGKSTPLQHMFPDTTYITFDHLQQVEAAREAPEQRHIAPKTVCVLQPVAYQPGRFGRRSVICLKTSACIWNLSLVLK